LATLLEEYVELTFRDAEAAFMDSEAIGVPVENNRRGPGESRHRRLNEEIRAFHINGEGTVEGRFGAFSMGFGSAMPAFTNSTSSPPNSRPMVSAIVFCAAAWLAAAVHRLWQRWSPAEIREGPRYNGIMTIHRRWRLFTVAAAFGSVVAFLLWFSADGLGAYFTQDDVMNLVYLHGYFTTPLYRLLLDVFNPMTAAYRPMGGLFYRTLYALAGFHPLPFRLVCFLLLLGNLTLSWRVLWTLSNSAEAALLGALGLAYNAEMSQLYFNTGTIYDILSYTFFVLALLFYVKHRKQGGGLSGIALVWLLLLTLFALQSKEMACTIPAVLLWYEVCFWPLHITSLHAPVRRLASRFLPVFATALLCGLFAVALLSYRYFGATTMGNFSLYQPKFSFTFYLRSCARYQGLIFYSPDLFGVPGVLCLWSAGALLAILLRNRVMLFGLGFWIVTLAPVAVIPERPGFVLYIPMLGLALYGGVLVAQLSGVMQRQAASIFHNFTAGAGGRRAIYSKRAIQVLVFGLAIGGLAFAHTHRRNLVLPGEVRAQQEGRRVVTDVNRLHATMEPAAQILFLNGPFAANQWYLQFALQLLYNDAGIRVDGAENHPHARGYTHVLSYVGRNLTEVSPPPAPCPPPVSLPGVIDDSSAQLCWAGDWQSQRFPETSDGTITFTNQAGATVMVAFEGSGLRYVYTMAYNRGKAELIIDGGSPRVIDLYSRDVKWQASTVVDGLATGRHTAMVRVLGKRNPAATDSIVDVDAFVVAR
jgi:hypothetical protein